MSRGRRGLLLGGLAIVLASLAASDVSGREAALRRRLGPTVDVVVTRARVPAGTRLSLARMAVRRVPARFAPAGAFAVPSQLVGMRVTGALAPGADLTAGALDAGPRGGAATAGSGAGAGAGLGKGERVVDVNAVGSPQAVVAGGRVDVLVTREASGGAPGRTTLALEDVEVLAVRAAAATASDRSGAARVTASLRVTLREAVYLAAAQSFARELRLLPRAAGDRGHAPGGLSVSDRL